MDEDVCNVGPEWYVRSRLSCQEDTNRERWELNLWNLQNYFLSNVAIVLTWYCSTSKQSVRLFCCGGNGVLRLLAPFLLLLWSDDYREGEAYRAGGSSGALPSIHCWILANLLEACNVAMLFSSPKISLSISLKFKKQERCDSFLYALSSPMSARC